MPRRGSDSTARPNGQPPAIARDRRFGVEWVHRVRFTRDAFGEANTTLRSVIRKGPDEPRRAIICLDSGLHDAQPDLLERAEQHVRDIAGLDLAGETIILPGGERSKNDRAHADAVIKAIHDAGLCRRSYVIAIGGGAMLDVAGYAAAVAHRGVRLIRFPTTTLAQDDSGIGVKNGINAFGKKNFLGTFVPPWAVINDLDTLTSLADRDWRAGFSEAVKVACVKDAAFFEVIETRAASINARDLKAAEPIIRRSAELHLDHIVTGGDPFELNEARPLDFGHWAAHKLEAMTDFEVKHGEAVAIGIALDVAYSQLAGWLNESEADRVHACLSALGFDLWHAALTDRATLLAGLEEFREHLGGRLTVSMLKGIGRSFEVHEMDEARIAEAIDVLRAKPQAANAG